MSQNLLIQKQNLLIQKPVWTSLILMAEFPVRIFWSFFTFQFFNMLTTLKFEKWQCSAHLPNIKYNCGVLFWSQLYWIFLHDSKHIFSTNTKILAEITNLVILGRNYWSSCRVSYDKICTPNCRINTDICRSTPKKLMTYYTILFANFLWFIQYQMYISIKYSDVV